MDPWVDFIGVPKEQSDDKGQFLDLVRPKDFRDDEVEALFFDEYNRAPKKVQNAVMELIQFRSINGRKFSNLRFIWAAINDNTSDQYNIEELDYAQLDRFQVILRLPSNPNIKWFSNNFGKSGTDICKWWDQLPDNLKEFISPRRLEYILSVYTNGGNISQLVPSNANTASLINHLKCGDLRDTLTRLVKENDKEEVRKWLQPEKNYSMVEDHLISNHLQYCFPLLSGERQAKIVYSTPKVKKIIESNIEEYKDLIISLRMSKDKSISNWAKDLIPVEAAAPSKTIMDPSVVKNIADKLVSGYSSPPRAISVVTKTISKQLDGKTWDIIDTSGVDNIIVTDTDTNEELLSYIVPRSDEPYNTTQKKLHIASKLLSLSKYNRELVQAVFCKLNYYLCGIQQSTYYTMPHFNECKTTFKNLMVQFLNENKGKYNETLYAVLNSPIDFFSKYEFLYLFAVTSGVFDDTK